jgi:hypothetical protein
MAEEGEKKKGRLSRLFGGMGKVVKGKEKEATYKIDGKTYKKDNETCEFVNVKNSNDRLPLYAFGEHCERSKLKEVI